jgi:hypothetical protein
LGGDGAASAPKRGIATDSRGRQCDVVRSCCATLAACTATLPATEHADPPAARLGTHTDGRYNHGSKHQLTCTLITKTAPGPRHWVALELDKAATRGTCRNVNSAALVITTLPMADCATLHHTASHDRQQVSTQRQKRLAAPSASVRERYLLAGEVAHRQVGGKVHQGAVRGQEQRDVIQPLHQSHADIARTPTGHVVYSGAVPGDRAHHSRTWERDPPPVSTTAHPSTLVVLARWAHTVAPCWLRTPERPSSRTDTATRPACTSQHTTATHQYVTRAVRRDAREHNRGGCAHLATALPHSGAQPRARPAGRPRSRPGTRARRGRLPAPYRSPL